MPEKLIPANVKEVAKYFREKMAPTFVNMCIQFLEMSKKGAYIPGRMLAMSCSCIAPCISNAELYPVLLKPRLQYIITECLFPHINYSEEDDALWRDDAHEYVTKSFGKCL